MSEGNRSTDCLGAEAVVFAGTMSKPLTISLWFVLALTIVVALSPTARADDDEDSVGNRGGTGEELAAVLITARRREERLQDVPLPVSVLSGATLDAMGTLNVGEVAELDPTLQFFSSNPRNSALTIRGLGSPFGLTNDGIEPGVGLYIDQVYYARSAATTFDFLDADQVEILRGPQGTLYGKNTTAGAINVTSRAPSFTPQADAEVSYGNYGYVQTRDSLSGALVGDMLAVRLGVSYTSRGGTIYDTMTGRRINAEDNLGVKGQLLLRMSDALTSTLYFDYSYENPLCCGQLYVGTGLTQRPLGRQFAALAAASNYVPPSLNPFDRVTDLDAELKAKQRFGGTSLLTEWTIGPGTLTSVTAWRYWDWNPANDRDFTGLPITTVSQNPSVQQQWSQEVRFAGTTGSIDYGVGLFGFHQTIDTSGSQIEGPYASLWLLSGANARNPAILDGLSSSNDIGLKTTSAAIFGELTWHVTDALRLQPGLRFNHDEKSGKYIATVTNATDTPLTAAQLGGARASDLPAQLQQQQLFGEFHPLLCGQPGIDGLRDLCARLPVRRHQPQRFAAKCD